MPLDFTNKAVQGKTGPALQMPNALQPQRAGLALGNPGLQDILTGANKSMRGIIHVL